MQVTKGTWRMRKQCVPGSLSSSPAQEPGNEANCTCEWQFNLKGSSIPIILEQLCCSFRSCHTRLTNGRCSNYILHNRGFDLVRCRNDTAYIQSYLYTKIASLLSNFSFHALPAVVPVVVRYMWCSKLAGATL